MELESSRTQRTLYEDLEEELKRRGLLMSLSCCPRGKRLFVFTPYDNKSEFLEKLREVKGGQQSETGMVAKGLQGP